MDRVSEQMDLLLERPKDMRAAAGEIIELLIGFLDMTCGDPDREPDEGAEPSLGWTLDGRGYFDSGDREQDNADDEDGGDNEPSLGSLDQPEDQTRWGFSSRKDLEEQCEDEGVSV
jgi:hypothetical protein